MKHKSINVLYFMIYIIIVVAVINNFIVVR